VYPALAVLQEMTGKEGRRQSENLRHSPINLRILWIGGVGGMEERLVMEAGIPFEAVPAAGVHGVSWRALPGNAARLVQGFYASRRLLQEFQPDVVFSTGGYVSVPVALAAHLPGRGYPRPRSLLYIPDIEPGLALKSLARFTDHIATTTPDTRAYLQGHPGVIVTGYPTRRDLRSWSRDESLRVLALTDDLPVLLVFGGSKGSRSINRALWASLKELLPVMQIVHITGELDWPQVEGIQARLAAEESKELAKRYHPYAFLHQEMGAALAAADLAVCRAGASTLGELPLAGLPAVLVPYPHAWRYQQVNAQYLAQRGAAVIVQDTEMPALLAGVVLDLIKNSRKVEEMRVAIGALAQPEASAKIAAQLLGLGGEA